MNMISTRLFWMKAFLFAIGLVFLVGCSRQEKVQKIEGQVFILMESGQTLKLSLVPIAILTEAGLKDRMANISALTSAQFKECSNRKAAKAKEIEDLDQKIQEADSVQQSLREKHRGATARLEEMQNNFTASWSRLSFKDRETAAQSVQAQKEKIYRMDDEGLLRKQKIEDLQSAKTKAKAQWIELLKEELEITSANPLFDHIEGLKTITSDADGKFQFTVTLGHYYILAKSNRRVGEKIEEYKWLVPVKENPVFLNNATLYRRSDIPLSKDN